MNFKWSAVGNFGAKLREVERRRLVESRIISEYYTKSILASNFVARARAPVFPRKVETCMGTRADLIRYRYGNRALILRNL